MGQIFLAQHRTLANVARIADETSCATRQCDWVVAGVLEAAQHDKWDQVACMEGVARGVEPTVQRDGVLTCLAQGLKIGGLIDQSAPLQFIDDIHGGLSKSRS